MSTKNLLVELLVEELPPKSLKKLGESLAEVLSASLKAQGLVTADATVTTYASRRRLGVHVGDVAAKADDKAVSQKLMPASVGLDASATWRAVSRKAISTAARASASRWRRKPGPMKCWRKSKRKRLS